jgi:hypothetical protein
MRQPEFCNHQVCDHCGGRFGMVTHLYINMMNRAHTLQMASPLPLRKTAIVMWSGTSRPVSHITSTLRPFENLKRWHVDIAVRPSPSA